MYTLNEVNPLAFQIHAESVKGTPKRECLLHATNLRLRQSITLRQRRLRRRS